MTEHIEQANSRGRSPFPQHWRNLHEGQDREERRRAILANIARDKQSAGDTDAAVAVLRAYASPVSAASMTPAEAVAYAQSRR